MKRLSGIAVILGLSISLGMVLWVPYLFHKSLSAFLTLAGLNVAPYGLLLLIRHRSRNFSPGLIAISLVAFGMAAFNAYGLYDITILRTDVDGSQYRTTDSQGGMGYGIYLIVQLIVIVLPLGIALEMAHSIRRSRNACEGSGSSPSNMPNTHA